ncbi:MAG: F0F1 ATP synthase subunit delta [Puniceicoccales bacterium]|jgi:F-type H+-transporting ATPase subunit delta|nr:F0F1 ATP synthase subunit delta [Puniceicoccales bacterium]
MPADIHAEVRRLVALSRDATGAVSDERVRAILDTLTATRKPAAVRPLLKVFHAAVRREIAKGEARIEHAGALPPTAPAHFAAHFSKRYGRPVRPVVSENAALIAGVRVRVGDDVFDASIRNALDRLAAGLA